MIFCHDTMLNQTGVKPKHQWWKYLHAQMFKATKNPSDLHLLGFSGSA